MPYINKCDGKFTTDLRTKAGDGAGSRLTQLIWGDPVFPTGESENGYIEVRARGRGPGWIPSEHAGGDDGKGLLEFYIIDVGQGDGVLFRTPEAPDGNWHMIDAGVSNERQMTGKGAANFVRWKFNRELKKPAVLETVTLSHPDFDHYGGMLNLFSGDLEDGEANFGIKINSFYHGGMSRFNDAPELGNSIQGTVPAFPIGGYHMRKRDRFITELLEGESSFRNPEREFKSSFSELANLVADSGAKVKRLGCNGRDDEWFPNYSPGDGVTGPAPKKHRLNIKILGPLLEEFIDDNNNQRLGLRELASESKTRNGHSVTLRFDYGNARILMTGDLNAESQRLLLSYIDPSEYRVDVAKGCHHGSEDIDFRFLDAMKARATVISSGDNEDYAHPRPVVIGGSAFYGREIKTHEDKTFPPLIYSTELARSVKLTTADRVRVDHDNSDSTRMKSYPSDRAQVKGKSGRYRNFSSTPISTGLVYGLVNVRTDGDLIMCATMEEIGVEFDIKVFQAGTP